MKRPARKRGIFNSKEEKLLPLCENMGWEMLRCVKWKMVGLGGKKGCIQIKG